MASLSAQATGGLPPAQVVDAAEHAISADSDGVVRARWNAALKSDPDDREALLGLASLARGTYAFETPDTLLTRLLALGGPEPDAWTVQARLGLYRVANAMGDIPPLRFAAPRCHRRCAAHRGPNGGDRGAHRLRQHARLQHERAHGNDGYHRAAPAAR